MVIRDYSSLALRAALGATFLVSVADRFGLLGHAGTAGVSFGTFARFTSYVGVLNWYLPHAVIPALAWIDTALEFVLGVALVAGFWLRTTAIASSFLLLIFAVTLAMAAGIGTPFQYSVFTACAAAWMLGVNSQSSYRQRAGARFSGSSELDGNQTRPRIF